MKRKIISITGDLASGKTVISEMIKNELDYEIYRNGQYVRKLAKDMEMNIKDFNVYLMSHPEIDLQIEKSAGEYAKDRENLIIEARLGFYAVPDSFKVYLKTDLDVAAERAMNDKNRADTEKYLSIEQAKNDIKARYDMENERYEKLYNVKRYDMSNYDFVFDTTNSNPELAKKAIIDAYNEWLEE